MIYGLFLLLPFFLFELLLANSIVTAAGSMIVPLHTQDNFSKFNNGKGIQKRSGPITVLVHGLDSSGKTWENNMTNLDTPCVAIDQRGSGYSQLGDPLDFSQDALIQDLHQVIMKQCDDNGENKQKIVLVGHSLGGRIVIGYAAVHPERISALVIEDMDIEPRTPNAHGIIKLKPYDGIFERQRESKEALIEALRSVGYPDEFIEKGLATGRIEPSPFVVPDKASSPSESLLSSSQPYWSHINPDFRKLCYRHVLSTTQGKKDCQTIATLFDEKKINFPCHVMVAGTEGTVCIEESIEEMNDILGDQLSVHRYPAAGHSIHSTAADEFRVTIQSIIRSADTTTAKTR